MEKKMSTTREIPHRTNQKNIRIFEDVKINVKLKLSALWIALMFLYTYADILGFYAPGNIEELISGEIAGMIPSAMVFLSLSLQAKANRTVNMIVGIVYIVVLGSTFLTGRNPAYYILFAILKATLLALIVWHAWKWPKMDA